MGEKINPPNQVPKMAGPPAIVPSNKNWLIFGLVFNNGVAIPIPSVILCRVNPITKNVPIAASPSAKEEPIAKPSPKFEVQFLLPLIRQFLMVKNRFFFVFDVGIDQIQSTGET